LKYKIKLSDIQPLWLHNRGTIQKQPLLAYGTINTDAIGPGADPDIFPGRRAKKSLPLVLNAGYGTLRRIVLVPRVLAAQNILRQHRSLREAVHRLKRQAHKLGKLMQLFFGCSENHRRGVKIRQLADIFLLPHHVRQRQNELLDRVELRAEAPQSGHVRSLDWNSVKPLVSITPLRGRRAEWRITSVPGTVICSGSMVPLSICFINS